MLDSYRLKPDGIPFQLVVPTETSPFSLSGETCYLPGIKRDSVEHVRRQ